MMSCVPDPRIRVFWSNALRVPAIADKINRDRFFKLRKHLKVVIDDDISADNWQILEDKTFYGSYSESLLSSGMIPFTSLDARRT